MKINRLLVLLAAFVLGFTTLAFADGIDHRVRIAHEQIERGVLSGSLTRHEANRLRGELNSIREDEARMKANGRLSHHERERLNAELNRLERHISNLKHNDNRRGHDDRRDHEHRRY